jgi:hypothetical protein
MDRWIDRWMVGWSSKTLVVVFVRHSCPEKERVFPEDWDLGLILLCLLLGHDIIYNGVWN